MEPGSRAPRAPFRELSIFAPRQKPDEAEHRRRASHILPADVGAGKPRGQRTSYQNINT